MHRDGSITVLTALSLMLIASFLFALLEAGRIYGLSAYADKKTQLGLESVCAEYQPGLYQDYGLLCLDGAYGGDTFSTENVENVLTWRIRRNLEQEGINFFRMGVNRSAIEEYQLLTDAKGKVFIQQVSSYMKNKMGGDILQVLLDQYRKSSEVAQDTQVKNSVENADMAVAEAKKAKEEEDKAKENAQGQATGHTGTENQAETGGQTNTEEQPETGSQTEAEEVQENPLELVLELKRNAVLGLMLGDISGVSKQTADFSECVVKRTLLEGNVKKAPDISFLDKCLAVEYLGQSFSDYVHPKEGHMFSYELEYVLCGKDSDAKNLESAVERLLLLRESANFLYILQDMGKMKEALAVATSLVGFSGNAAVIRVVQIGVVAAWAFIESVLDVRALLQGDKIALIKANSEWTTDTAGLMESLSSGSKAKECQNGLTYQQYLKTLIALESVKKMAYRSLNLIEFNLRAKGYTACRMDHMICSMSCRVFYQANSQFGQLSVIGNIYTDGYDMRKVKKFAYQL